jgi:hypothetical protein
MRRDGDMDRSHYPTRIIRPGESEPPDPVWSMTPEQRLEMMWPLTLEAWRFMGIPVDELRLQRHVVRVVRRGR